MYCISKAAHGSVAHASEYAHHSTGSTHHVHQFDAKNTTECRRNDGGVECAACSATGITIDARPTKSHGICEKAPIHIPSIWLLTRFENPDIVQAFFGCLDTVSCYLAGHLPLYTKDVAFGQVAKHFVAVFYNLPPGALDALMQCAVSSLSLQERYSLVATCTFLVYQRSSPQRYYELSDLFTRKH